jgi:hypothetical protein
MTYTLFCKVGREFATIFAISPVSFPAFGTSQEFLIIGDTVMDSYLDSDWEEIQRYINELLEADDLIWSSRPQDTLLGGSQDPSRRVSKRYLE